jgi:hypothetical protein
MRETVAQPCNQGVQVSHARINENDLLARSRILGCRGAWIAADVPRAPDDEARRAAFAEFFRVLRPGGRISLFEPINRFMEQRRPNSIFDLPPSPVDDLLAKVRDRRSRSLRHFGSHHRACLPRSTGSPRRIIHHEDYGNRGLRPS